MILNHQKIDAQVFSLHMKIRADIYIHGTYVYVKHATQPQTIPTVLKNIQIQL